MVAVTGLFWYNTITLLVHTCAYSGSCFDNVIHKVVDLRLKKAEYYDSFLADHPDYWRKTRSA